MAVIQHPHTDRIAASPADAETLMAWAVDRWRDRIALSVSFGGGGIVLAHMLARIAPSVPVVFLDTGMHFAETLAYRDRFARRYGLALRIISPDDDPGPLYLTDPDDDPGPLYLTDPDGCCTIRKVEPMQRVLREFDAWISAVRRDQSSSRATLEPVERHDADGRPLAKIHPLAAWSRADVWRYISEHEIPYHPLLDQGYTSIGCAPCTQPTIAGEPERAGRWRGAGKLECGLHTFSRRAEERT